MNVDNLLLIFIMTCSVSGLVLAYAAANWAVFSWIINSMFWCIAWYVK